MKFTKELEERIDKEIEKMKRYQEENGDKTYTQEELDAIILGEFYRTTI